MKISISYPPISDARGTPLLSQNRQFQYFSEPCFIYPMVPSSAATLLKQSGHHVIWDDSIAERKKEDNWFRDIENQNPDLVAIETKTPVIKQHWRIINKLKEKIPKMKIVLFGDHVTALPKESFLNSKVDFVLTGGDYDFLLLNLVNYLEGKEKLEPGIWLRDGTQIKNTGKFELKHDLNGLPFIDRDLTKWKRYAYDNGNYKKLPGTYTMAGRDCWHAKCTFCLHPETKILTNLGMMNIKDIVEDNGDIKVLTHKCRFKNISKRMKRSYNKNIIEICSLYLPYGIKLTPNHKLFSLKRDNMKRCSHRSCWSYFCKPYLKSKFLRCKDCNHKYYKNYQLNFTRADELRKGDYLAVPIIREIKDIKKIRIENLLNENPMKVKTTKVISEKKIEEIFELHDIGVSQREIARKLDLNRETIKRYLHLRTKKSLDFEEKCINLKDGLIWQRGNKNKIKNEILISEDFLRLVGYYLSEGHVHKLKSRPNSWMVGFTFSQKEERYINDVKVIFKKIFGIELNEIYNQKNHTVQLYTGSSILGRFFKTLFGKDCYKKIIPNNFMYLPLKKQRELLSGLFRGDGHLRIRNRCGIEYIFGTVSEKLATQVFLLLLRQNVIPSFHVLKRRGKATAQQFSISLSHLDINKVFPEIKLPLRRNNYKHGFIFKNYAMIPVKSIKEEKYNGYVYNLTIEDDHSYTANLVNAKNCSWTTTYPSYRSSRPEKLLEEIEMLIEKYGIKEIMDDSGSFPIGSWLKKFCNGMIENGYNKQLNLDCNMRFGALSFEEYKLMKKAGFRLLLFGLESANQVTLDRINKKLKVEEIVRSCRKAKKAGLEPHITIMFGYPWETKKHAQKTLDLGKYLMKKGYADTLQSTVVIPYPGTPLFEEAKKNNWLKTMDWNRYDMDMPILKTPMSDSEINEMVQGLYRVAFNPEFVLRKILGTRSPDDIKFFLRAGKKVLGHVNDFSH